MLSLSALAVPQILYSTEPVLASGLDQEGGTVVLGILRQLSVLHLESEISRQSGKEACILYLYQAAFMRKVPSQ